MKERSINTCTVLRLRELSWERGHVRSDERGARESGPIRIHIITYENEDNCVYRNHVKIM